IVKADGTEVTKSFSESDFKDLADGDKDSPISCMWNYSAGSGTYQLSTSIEYVTIEALVNAAAGSDADALAVYNDPSAVLTYAAADASNTRKVADLKAGKFFGTDDVADAKSVAAGFGLNWKTTKGVALADGNTAQATAASELDANPSYAQAPRMFFGLTDDEYDAKSFPGGMQMLSSCLSITIEIPE
ncbi:MAG: hypothetical protein IJH04_11790, partial [Eggerthellaceae bacterium]|nr:hypothetical protein [Eggerthellaceae bacterium]